MQLLFVMLFRLSDFIYFHIVFSVNNITQEEFLRMKDDDMAVLSSKVGVQINLREKRDKMVIFNNSPLLNAFYCS
jgi:hypothetical protein